MKTEPEVRALLEVMRTFNRPSKSGDGIMDREMIALSWVLGEWPIQPKAPEVPEGLRDAVEGFHIRQSQSPGGFPVRSVPTKPKEGE